MIRAEHTVQSFDGTELFYRSWIPEKPTDKALLLFHRGHEHSGRWDELVNLLALDDVAIFAWDARGHGRSPGPRGGAENFAVTIKDVDVFVRHISETHGIASENIVALAHSMGAVSVAGWVHDYAPPIRAMILATAAFKIRLYVPLALPALRLKEKMLGPGHVQSYVKARMLTHDREEAALYDADPLIFRGIPANVLLDVDATAKRLLADAGAINVPTLMIGAGSDWVVSLKAQREFFNGLSSSVKQMHVFPAAYHAIFHERERAEVVARVRDFVRERFAQPPVVTALLEADRMGYTWEEHERLKLRGGPQFPLIRAAMKTGGRLSKGIDLGWQSGFDSGLALDYVYENKPAGKTRLGRLMDSAYLDSIGWRGIRQRKVNLVEALRRLIEETHAAGRPVRIVDIAAGAGRYVLETIQSLPDVPITAVLRDYKTENVSAMRALVEGWQLREVVVEEADAFNRASLGAIQPRATIGIVSGLYELFPSNKLVSKSLAGLADAIVPGGHLIYTNQPWHPQLEFIARVLRNREGQPWIMRRRTTAEMDQLVARAGFEKLAMEIDQWGMFSVSIARRDSATN
ncbi:MAG: bifunctional alpha/beta hydrolase/class I SAM-dependent methyltransferase [Chthoniobacterales bacterium]